MARILGLEKLATIVLSQQTSFHTKNGKKSITILQLYNASGLQSTNLIVLKSDNNLQVLTPFHLQSTTKFWYKSTIYI